MKMSDIERLAYHGEPMPDSATLLELGYYTALRKIYSDYADGKITQEDGARLKDALRQKMDDENGRAKAYARYQDAIRVCGTLRADINKSNDIHEIADKLLQCVALMTGDTYFYDNNYKKLEACNDRP